MFFLSTQAISKSNDDFVVYDDSFAFHNFTLGEVKSRSNAGDFLVQSYDGSLSLDENRLEIFSNGLNENNFSDFNPEYYSRPQSKSAIADAFGYAHCWAMSYLTKQFFNHASFTSGDSRSASEVKRLAEKVAEGKSAVFHSENLTALSKKYETQLKQVLVKWQRKLLFSLWNVQYLTTEDPKDSFRKIKKSIQSGKLTLIMVKFSMTSMHVILGYGISGNTIYHYDCNAPGRKCRLVLKENGYYAPTYGEDVKVDIID